MWNYMVKRAFLEPGTYYYFLPSFAQAKRVIWDGMTNDGKRMLDFSSADFLGLGKHPDVNKSVIRYVLKYGTGTPPPEVEFAPQRTLEEKLAYFQSCF